MPLFNLKKNKIIQALDKTGAYEHMVEIQNPFLMTSYQVKSNREFADVLLAEFAPYTQRQSRHTKRSPKSPDEREQVRPCSG